MRYVSLSIALPTAGRLSGFRQRLCRWINLRIKQVFKVTPVQKEPPIVNLSYIYVNLSQNNWAFNFEETGGNGSFTNFSTH